MFIHDKIYINKIFTFGKFQNHHSVQGPDENLCFIHDKTKCQDSIITLSMYLNVFSLMLYK